MPVSANVKKKKCKSVPISFISDLIMKNLATAVFQLNILFERAQCSIFTQQRPVFYIL